MEKHIDNKIKELTLSDNGKVMENKFNKEYIEKDINGESGVTYESL